MNSSQPLKLTLACLCLALTAGVIAQGEARMKQQAVQPPAQTDDKSAPAPDKTTGLLADYERSVAETRELQKTVVSLQTQVESQVGKRRDEINRGAQSQQIGTNLLKDIAAAAVNQQTGAVKNAKLKELLDNNGISINFNKPTPAK